MSTSAIPAERDVSAGGLAQIAAAVPVQRLHWPPLGSRGIDLWLRRDDLLPAWCQGNKFYKLYHNLTGLQPGQWVLSFGGAYSNHLHALALAGQALGLQTVGIVRGQRPARLSPTLRDAEAAGMALVFVSRAEYGRWADCAVPDQLDAWLSQLTGLPAGQYRLVPEGGGNRAGFMGCKALGADIRQRLGHGLPHSFDECLVAVGTGTTLAGLAASLPGHWRVAGIPVLADSSGAYADLQARVQRWLQGQPHCHWQLLPGFAGAGYGRVSPDLLAFMRDFYHHTGVQLEQVYTAKLLQAISNLASQGRWPAGTRLLALHTGGLQGLRGLTTEQAGQLSGPGGRNSIEKV